MTCTCGQPTEGGALLCEPCAKAAYKAPSTQGTPMAKFYDEWADPREDIYTLADGEPIDHEGMFSALSPKALGAEGGD